MRRAGHRIPASAHPRKGRGGQAVVVRLSCKPPPHITPPPHSPPTPAAAASKPKTWKVSVTAATSSCLRTPTASYSPPAHALRLARPRHERRHKMTPIKLRTRCRMYCMQTHTNRHGLLCFVTMQVVSKNMRFLLLPPKPLSAGSRQ